jgi:hypothetical protein
MNKIKMGKYILVIVFCINFCFGQSTNSKIIFTYSELKNETNIQNLYQTDTIKLKGNWHKIESNEKSHFIIIEDSLINLKFFPYPKKNRDFLKPGMSKPQLLKTFVQNQTRTWSSLGLNYRILKSNSFDYTIIKFKDEIALLGIKGDNTIFLKMKYNRKEGFAKEFDNLLYFFEKTLLL